MVGMNIQKPISTALLLDSEYLNFSQSASQVISVSLSLAAGTNKMAAKMTTSIMCKLVTALGLHSALIEATCVERDTNSSAVAGCAALEIKFPGKTFYPGDDVYEYETSQFWSNTELMSPACVFRPESASDISASIEISTSTSTDFAVRGGGHMGIKVCPCSHSNNNHTIPVTNTIQREPTT